MEGEAVNIYILRQKEGCRASHSWSRSLEALLVAVKSGQDGQGTWEQGSPQPQTTHEAGVSGTPGFSCQNSEAPATARNRREGKDRILSLTHPDVRLG